MNRQNLPIILAALVAIPFAANAQDYAPAALEAMSKLQFLEGRWEGEIWTRTREGERVEGRVVEIVETKLSGAILTLEGLGAAGDPEDPDADLSHHAFAVIYFDAGDRGYRMHSYKDGKFLDATLEVTGDNEFEWGFDTPNGGRVRFQIGLDDNGRWVEAGHYSPDGETWHEYFGMTLERVTQ